MSKKSTEGKEERKMKSIMETVGREFFYMYCAENKVQEDCMKDLMNIRNTTKDEAKRVRVNIWIMEQLIGLAKQQTDITTGGHPINSVSFDILENDSNTGE